MLPSLTISRWSTPCQALFVFLSSFPQDSLISSPHASLVVNLPAAAQPADNLLGAAVDDLLAAAHQLSPNLPASYPPGVVMPARNDDRYPTFPACLVAAFNGLICHQYGERGSALFEENDQA
ncbi:MAG: hypothetical protein E6Q98_20250 [Rhodospirillaceae bacterium]|nr:MAG: hypothetical protein E6Q98_20250 [Rhodospirillaceae bacterium]